MPDAAAFPENLRRARLARRLTVRALGAQVGVTGAAISKYEMGKSYPGSRVLVNLARALNVGVDCLMCNEVCVAAPPPRIKPPTTRMGRARRWAALWKAKAREWRGAARFAVEGHRRAVRRSAAHYARIAALEAQLLAAQQANTRLIGRIVELEHERDKAMALIADYAKLINRLLFGGDGAIAEMDSISSYPAPRAVTPAETPPPPMPVEDALSSVASQLAAMIIQKRLDAGHTITFAGDAAPPRAVTPGRLCDHCTLPLVSAHIADEVRLELAGRRISVHQVCADYLCSREPWQPVATARGVRDA